MQDFFVPSSRSTTVFGIQLSVGNTFAPVVAHVPNVPCPHLCGHISRSLTMRPQEWGRGSHECARHQLQAVSPRAQQLSEMVWTGQEACPTGCANY
jgi:hypothetical protein